jgi:hydrogenase maturation protease
VSAARILVAGVGNLFLGDDGFGCELARRLAEQPLPAGVRVVDFGIRGLDLAYALGEGWDAAVLLDVAQRGGSPGTLYVIEPEPRALEPPGAAALEPHAMTPAQVLTLVDSLGKRPARVLVLACEPLCVDEQGAFAVGLSEPVERALGPALELAHAVISDLKEKSAHA